MFYEFGLKMPILTPPLCVFWRFDPLDGHAVSTRPQREHSRIITVLRVY